MFPATICAIQLPFGCSRSNAVTSPLTLLVNVSKAASIATSRVPVYPGPVFVSFYTFAINRLHFPHVP